MAETPAASAPTEKIDSASTSAPTTPLPHDGGYPRGHLGHLSESEEEAFRSFKAFLEEKGLYQPGPPASHDDPTLLRFLRARRWVVPDAYQQFKETEDWRAANQIQVLYDTIDLDSYEQSRRLAGEIEGIPVYLFEIRHLDSKTISNYEKTAEATYSRAQTDGKTPPKLLRLFALYENLTRFAQPLCTHLTDRDHADTPITLSTNIVDVSGVGLRQFWYLKSHMQAASQLATAHYPETLDRIFIIGAPAFFGTVWSWIKRWFDPITVSKIFILSPSQVKSTLEQFIDPANIPKGYGGQLDFTWADMPNLDPVIKETVQWENGHTDFPRGPIYWRPIDGGDRLECIAVGTTDQKDRLERVCTIPTAYKGQTAVPSGPNSAQAVPTAEKDAEKTDAEKTESASEPAASDPIADSVEGVDNLAINGKVGDDEKIKVTEKVANGATTQPPSATA